MLKVAVRLALVACALVVPGSALAAGVPLTTFDAPYVQSFDTLASSGTSSSVPPGWAFVESGTNANATYTAGTGSSNAGDTYSFGASASSERAFGGLQSGSLVPTVGAAFRNDTGGIVTSVDVAFTGEQWRLGTSGRGADRLDFQYSTTASDLGSGAWTDNDGLDFSSPVTVGTVGLLNGNAAADRAARSATIGPLTLLPGQTLWIRWNDFNATGSDDGLAVDDFSLVAHGIAITQVLSIGDATVDEGDSGATPASFAVTLSAPAGPGGVSFHVATADGTATVAGGDYVARSADVIIPEGGTSATFTVAVNGDTAIEADETFAVDVTNIVGAVAGDTHAVGTIANDDFPPATHIHTIQGAAHVSPYVGQNVLNVPGIVTQKLSNGFFMQDATPDDDPATSEGIFVFGSRSVGLVAVGDSVHVDGVVQEFYGSAPDTNLPVTELAFPTVRVVSHGNALPAATVWAPPTETIEDDAVTGDVTTSGVFDPQSDGLDYAESLEGMRVEIDDATASGPSRDFTSSSTTEVPLVAGNAGLRTPRGGVVIRANDQNPERLILQAPIHGVPPTSVGDRIQGATIGELDYNFGNFKLRPEAPVTVTPGNLQKEVTAPQTPQQLSVATFNVENLDPSDGAAKFDGLARVLVTNLRSPDIVNLEEVQDNDGAVDDHVVASNVTLDLLVAAIERAGGPHYTYRYIAPVDDQDGGEPGGNIRVAFLYQAPRVTFVDRGSADSSTPNAVVGTGADTHLAYSPGRIDPASTVWTSSRKPLAGEFVFRGHTVFVIANHFNSKGGDQPLMGRFQPAQRSSEVQRHGQAAEVRDFVAKLLVADPAANVVVAGDLNDFQFSDTLSILEQSGLGALIKTLPVDEQYTYDFDGNSQAIDHILLGPSLAKLVRDGDYDVVHVNSEFADQVSDHEPQVVRLLLNDAPTASAGGPYTVREGSTVAVAATATDPEGGVLTYAWDLDGDGTYETAGQAATFSAASLDGPTSRTVHVRVTDDAGASTVAAATVDVTNVAPTASLSAAPATVPEGTPVSLTGAATDPSPADAAALTFVWNVTKNGKPFASGIGRDVAYTPDDDGTYIVTFAASDDDGGSDTVEATTVALNVAPTAALAGAAATVAEGTLVTAHGSSTDPSPVDTVTYVWNVTKNGSPYRSGTGADVAYTPDDDGTYVVTLTATDDDGGAGTATAVTNVTNVAPTPSLAGLPATSPEGTALAGAGSSTDPGAADTVTYVWNVTKNGAPFASGAGASVAYTPDDNGAYVATLTATDDDGGVGTAEIVTIITNVAPTATLVAPASVTALDPIQLALASASDPSTADTKTGFEYRFDCGDGSGYGPWSPLGAVRCATADTGTRTVRGAIRDKDGGVAEYTASVNVTITVDALCSIVGGWAKNAGTANSLCVKLRHGQIAAFANEVDAQTGKAFTADQAATLKRLASRL